MALKDSMRPPAPEEQNKEWARFPTQGLRIVDIRRLLVQAGENLWEHS